ncbi:hypothetical protein JOD64_005256 [Micromonospora luteifusca]|uniref:Uncharacterized protein n=1 Tax=Micromonospora luteifusca TaxID=709860 RepID=A0ABS2M1J4_9ACTN|nr:hypothetical protein [Micromonospora luteifusca]
MNAILVKIVVEILAAAAAALIATLAQRWLRAI